MSYPQRPLISPYTRPRQLNNNIRLRIEEALLLFNLSPKDLWCNNGYEPRSKSITRRIVIELFHQALGIPRSYTAWVLGLNPNYAHTSTARTVIPHFLKSPLCNKILEELRNKTPLPKDTLSRLLSEYREASNHLKKENQ